MKNYFLEWRPLARFWRVTSGRRTRLATCLNQTGGKSVRYRSTMTTMCTARQPDLTQAADNGHTHMAVLGGFSVPFLRLRLLITQQFTTLIYRGTTGIGLRHSGIKTPPFSDHVFSNNKCCKILNITSIIRPPHHMTTYSKILESLLPLAPLYIQQ